MDDICSKTPARFQTNEDLVLSSVHLTLESFARRVNLADISDVRRLEKEALPTIDVVIRKEDQPAVTTDRGRRKVSV